jgi:membrane-bound lytic murein transglycosylase A
MNNIKTILFPFVLLVIFAGCSAKIEQYNNISKATMQKVDWDMVDGFDTDDLTLALNVFKKDCQVSKKYENLKEICKKANSIDIADAKDFFQINFTPFKLIGNNKQDQGLITGYYEPLLNGSLYKTKRYKYPIYAVPTNLLTIDLSNTYPELSRYNLRGKLQKNKVIPYDTRQQINDTDYRDSRYLKPICFVDDKIDLFFLHIQGSGKVKLPNGKILNIAYGQQNGRKYYSIGKELIKIGALKKDEVSLQSIKQWLVDNPDRVDEILNSNNSYLFFQKSQKGATGSLGTELTPNRNLAVDKRYIPLGFLVFVNTTNPITKKPINQLMVAADTGGAIKGKIRADFFFGYGENALKLAGNMKQLGKLYMLIPNNKIKED